jgi:hypothetical protein
MRFPRSLLLFVSIVLLTVRLLAQSPNGNINGLILDPSNRVIVDAEIVAVNDVTGVKYTGKTNNDGIYMLTNLPPGPYRLQVAKVGFKTIIKPDIILNVQDALSINFTLPVGAFHEVVTVEAGASLVNTESAAVSTVVDRQFAENLPMNGRSFQTLIMLTPGVVVVPPNASDTGQFSINGQRSGSNYWMVDGVSANIGVGTGFGGNGLGGAAASFNALGGTNSLVSVDAMQEFRIQTSTFAPEFGRTPGGQVSIVTRSGTNQFHGTAFDYLRNDIFDASDWFSGYTNSPPLPKAKDRQNDFGGTFSGPILKDKLFGFFSYEGLRLRLPQTLTTGVPDQVARESAVPAMRPYLNAFPLPNGVDNLTTAVAQFSASYSNPATLDAYSLRIDDRLSDRWALFARYDYSPSQTENRGSGGGGALSEKSISKIRTQTATAAVTSTPSSVVTNDLRFNYSRTDAGGSFALDNFGGAVPLKNPPFPARYNTSNANFGFFINELGIGGSFAVGKQARTVQRQFNLVDALSWQKGTHSLKLGVDFRRLSPKYLPFQYQQNAFFGDVLSSETGSSASGSVISLNDVTISFRNLGAYAQDTWHVSPHLTVTYGLRWDVDFAPASLDGPNIAAVTGYSLTNFSQLAVAPAGTSPFKTQYGNVAPRLGVAYQVSKSPRWLTVLRGGFGIFYDLANTETGNVLSFQSPPFGSSMPNIGGTFPFSSSQTAPVAIPPNGTLSNFFGFNPNLKLPYTLEWNVSAEQSLGEDQALSVSYIGASGRRLLQGTVFVGPTPPPTFPIPTIQQAGFVDNTAASNYNALQLQVHRRVSRGLQALASYTWSHSIDDASASSVAIGSNLGVPGGTNINRGNSDFDIRNAFSAGLTYDIPSPGGGAFENAILRGWSTQNFIVVRSAPPVDITDVHFFELERQVFSNIRPDVVPGEPFYLYGSRYPGGKALNASALTDPPSGSTPGVPLRQGDLSRNQLRGFGAAQWDFAVHRDFNLREPLKLQFRAEMFNLLNHPNFGPPFSSFGADGFGLATQMLNQSLSSASQGSGGFNPLYQIGGPRSIQLALKLKF